MIRAIFFDFYPFTTFRKMPKIMCFQINEAIDHSAEDVFASAGLTVMPLTADGGSGITLFKIHRLEQGTGLSWGMSGENRIFSMSGKSPGILKKCHHILAI